MTRTRISIALIAGLAVIFGPLAMSADAKTVSVNIKTAGETGVTGTAGVVPVGNWNNHNHDAANSSTAVGALIDDSGEATTSMTLQMYGADRRSFLGSSALGGQNAAIYTTTSPISGENNSGGQLQSGSYSLQGLNAEFPPWLRSDRLRGWQRQLWRYRSGHVR